MPAVHDTRLLSNLLKAEKAAQTSFKEYTSHAGAASAALNAWSTADSADTQDLMDVSARLAELVGSVLDSQRSYLHALSAYRTSLKDILKRETELKTVIRDREILVNRVIKLGNKRPGDNNLDSHQVKLEDAQRELAACEQFLQDEEIALSGVKRRTFREALSMRMRAMEDMGNVMASASAQSVQVLAQLVLDDYPNGDYYPDEEYEYARSTSSFSAYSDDGEQQQQQQYERAASPRPVPMEKRTSQAATVTQRAAPVVLPPPPTAPRLQIPSDEPAPLAVPKAPSNVMTRKQVAEDSSDEEDESSQQPARPVSQAQHQRPALLHRRMNSDASSSVGNAAQARKRRGSFFGSIASFFKGSGGSSKAPSSRATSGRYDSTPAVTSVWDTRTESNVNRAHRDALSHAARFRPSNDSSDEEGAMPKNVVRVVNDPKARVKALSDIGTGTKSTPPKRLSTSKSKRSLVVPEKALSDAGVGSKSTRPTFDTMSVTSDASTARVGKKKSSGTIKKKKAASVKATGALGGAQAAASGDKMVTTVIQTNLPPGSTLMNASTDLRAPKLSRSNTTATARTSTTVGTTTTTGTQKKKKKKAASATTVPAVPPVPPTADDLAGTLPTAKSSYAYKWEKEMADAKAIEQKTGAAPVLSTGATDEEEAIKPKKKKKASTTAKSSVISSVNQVNEGDESLMSLVERTEGASPEKTSRSYQQQQASSKTTKAAGTATNTLAVPASSDLSRTTSQASASPSLAKRKSVRLSTKPDGSAEGGADGTPGAATANGAPLERSVSPSGTATPSKGILRSTTPAPAPAVEPRNAWQTRNGTAAAGGGGNNVLGAQDVDSSDDSSDDEGYRKFRQELARGEREFKNAMLGKWSKEEKGKGKA